MSSVGHAFKGYTGTGWKIANAMEAMSAQEIHDVAETALSDFEEVKGPAEIRTAVMKSVGIHLKDMLGATAYLESAANPIPYPSDQELEDWVGWNPALMYTLRELKSEADAAKVRTERMAVILTSVLKKLKGLEAAEALRAEKEMNFRKGFQESKGNEASELIAENQSLKEHKTNEAKEVAEN